MSSRSKISAATRPSDEDDAVGLFDGAGQGCQHLIGKTEIVDGLVTDILEIDAIT